MTYCSSKYIQTIAPSKRSIITEDQAALFALMIQEYEANLMHEFELRDISELDLELYDISLGLPSYKRMLLAGYACGFVCRDLDASFCLYGRPEDLKGTLQSCNLARLRHYLHTLIRSERL